MNNTTLPVSISSNILSVEISPQLAVRESVSNTSLAVESLPAPFKDIYTTVNEKMRRPAQLDGRTYKIKTPLSDSSMYLTINNIVLNKDTEHEVSHPFEIFINGRDMQNYQWVVAFTLMISAIFRKGGDVTFIIEELKSIFDPAGGYFTARGRIPSLVAEIGYVIEDHFKHLGLISSELSPEVKQFIEEKKDAHTKSGGSLTNAKVCPKCGAQAVVTMDNCPVCLECGDSKCG